MYTHIYIHIYVDICRYVYTFISVYTYRIARAHNSHICTYQNPCTNSCKQKHTHASTHDIKAHRSNIPCWKPLPSSLACEIRVAMNWNGSI